ncbi:Bud site selection protein, Revert to axial protein 1, partial [Coemansia biformis]
PSDGQLVVAPSLLDPHPIIVPPPGSRLAFAGANTARMARIFRALPSLEDTLLRRAQEPLCLFNYWQYLADIEAGSEELEFWLSLADYEALFRKHRRFESPPALSPASMQPAALSPNPATLRLAASAGQRGGRAESGALGISSMRDEASEQLAQSLSQLRGQEAHTFDAETRELDNHLAQLSWQTTKATHSTVCKAHRQCTFAHRPFTAAHASGGPTLDTPAQVARSRGVRGFFARMFTDEPGGRRRDRAVVQKEPLLPHMEHPADDELATVPTEGEMQRAAERLYFHYFLPESPSPLRVSARMRDEVSLRVEREQSFDAEVFVSAKRHAYEAMRYESHMRFLRERLYHNITRGTAAPRIVLGLTLIFVALASQLSLIFLDVKPKAWRWLPIAGLWPGFVYVFAGLSRLDPFMALAARYESTAWALGRVRDKTVRLAHLKRAVLQLAAAAAIAAIISVVMFVVPGHHL